MKVNLESISERNGINFLSPTDKKVYSVGISTGGLAEIKMARSDRKRHIIATTVDLGRLFSTLSTGQRKRMMLLALVLEKPNVLLAAPIVNDCGPKDCVYSPNSTAVFRMIREWQLLFSTNHSIPMNRFSKRPSQKDSNEKP